MKLTFKSRTSKPDVLPAGAQGDGAADPLRSLGGEMSFLDHLEELRWSLIKGFAAIIVATIVAAFFSDWIVDVLLMGPAKSDFFMYRILGLDAETLVLQSRNPTGQFFAHMGIIFAVGIVLGSPLFIYCMWKFVEPGLYPNEKSGMRFASFFATFFFMLGLSFGYCITTPFALQFFANYQISDLIINEFDITRYFSMVTGWAFGAGLLFEMPVVIYFLAKLGIATPERLRSSRKYALLGVLILGAFLTPPDPLSQILVAMPLMALYEGSIYVAGFAERKRQRMLRKAWGDEPPTPAQA
jgi:sec-independent protein translocase protein TatC